MESSWTTSSPRTLEHEQPILSLAFILLFTQEWTNNRGQLDLPQNRVMGGNDPTGIVLPECAVLTNEECPLLLQT